MPKNRRDVEWQMWANAPERSLQRCEGEEVFFKTKQGYMATGD